MPRMKMSRELAFSKMRKFQDSLVKKVHGFCSVEYYCDDEYSYEQIRFRIWFCDSSNKDGGFSVNLEWSTSNADKFYPLWQEFEEKVRGIVSLTNKNQQ